MTVKKTTSQMDSLSIEIRGMMESMLQWDARKRSTALEILQHPTLRRYSRQIVDAPTADMAITNLENLDNTDLRSLEEFRSLVCKEATSGRSVEEAPKPATFTLSSKRSASSRQRRFLAAAAMQSAA